MRGRRDLVATALCRRDHAHKTPLQSEAATNGGTTSVSSDSQKGRDGARPSITPAGIRSALLLRAERDCFSR
jgi:hypothetical protein